MARRSGRRPGASGTREAIRAAATRQFSELGYDRTSMRSVASEAGVDPALVAHYFGGKQQLFVQVMELPFEPAQVLPTVFAGDPASAGRRLAEFVVAALEDPEARARILGIIRSAASEPEAARMVRELITRRMVAPIVAALASDDADLRATLVGSQIVGFVTARHIVGVEPLASLAPERAVAALAPTLQRYLTGPLE